MRIIITAISFAGLSIAAFAAHAQKLPKVQKASVRAPENIKVDGEATEWHGQFQAYNKATSIFYTMANDANNIYLIVQATDQNTIKKIVQGGITLAINTSDKKEDKNNLAVTFPKYDKRNHPFYLNPDKAPKTADTLNDKMLADSLMHKYNKQLNNKLQSIGVTGIKGIPDSIISIYNEESIKAAAQFDHKIHYIFELSLPIKYVTSNQSDKAISLHYNIKLNGPMGNGSTVTMIPGRNVLTFKSSDGINYSLGEATQENMDFAYPTDFWGVYTLKK